MAMAVEYEGFEVRDVTVIEHGKTTWIPTTKVINNIKFIQLSKWNRDFVRFVGGKGLDFRNTQLNPANSEFFESLLAARKRASKQAVIDALAVDEEPKHADDMAVQDPLLRRARNPKRTKTWSWASLCSSETLAHPFVTIKVQGHCMKVMTELRSNSLWVEFTKENMAFIQAGVQASGKGRCHKRKKGSAALAIEAEDGDADDGAGRETVDLKAAETLDK